MLTLFNSKHRIRMSHYVFYVCISDLKWDGTMSAFFSLNILNRLPKVDRYNGTSERRGIGWIGPWEERVPAVPLAPRLSPRKVAPRPRHFLLYNRYHAPKLSAALSNGMRHPNLWRWRHKVIHSRATFYALIGLFSKNSALTGWQLFLYKLRMQSR